MDNFISAEYLQTVASDIIKIATDNGADQVSVNLSRSLGRTISTRHLKLETIESIRDQTIAITVYFNNCKGSVSSSDLSMAALKKTIIKACRIAKYTEADSAFGLAAKERLASQHTDLALDYPMALTNQDLITIAQATEQAGFDYSAKITNSEGVDISTERAINVYANSHGFNDFSQFSTYSLSCSMIAQDGEQMQRDYDYSTARNFNDLLDAATTGNNAAQKSVAKLNPQAITTGKFPVILDAAIAGSIFGNLLSAISGSALYHKTSFLLDSLETKILPEFINITENPLLAGGLSSTAFDGEGVATKDKFIVEQGIIKTYLLSSYTARKLKMQTTANAGGSFNLQLTTNFADQKSLLKEMGTGLLVTEFMGSSTNMMTGDYSRGASGFWVEAGIIKFPVAEITIAGNLLAMFNNIVGIAGDIDNRNNIATGSVLISEMMLSGS